MKSSIRNLILTPDASASKRIRSELATRSLGFGVKVVTRNELIDELRLAYLMPEHEDNWLEILRDAMETMPNAFWAKSFSVDPVGASSAIADTLDQILRNSEPKADWQSSDLSSRINNILADLKELWNLAGKPLPVDLAIIEGIEAKPDAGIYAFSIYCADKWPRLDTHLKRLIDALNAAGGRLEPELQHIVEAASQPPTSSPTSPPPQVLAANCFSVSSKLDKQPDALSFLMARDPLEEAECAVTAIQRLVGNDVSPQEIGLLLPDDQYYHRAVGNAVSMAGIHTAGLSNEYSLRDLGGEVARSLLLIARGPVPKMAFAALLASPIAPWRQSVGNRLASYVMSGRFNLRALREMTPDEEKSLMAVQRLRDNKITVSEVIEIYARGVENTAHSLRLRTLGKSIGELEAGSGDTDYDLLLNLVGHVEETLELPISFPQNGIRIFSERQDPWTEVKHLFVLGFNGGRYPSIPGTSPVFHNLDKQSINTALGWELPMADNDLRVRRSRLQRQIAAASETATFFASARNMDGSPAQLSETATFIAGLIGSDPEELFVSVQEHNGRLPEADEAEPISIRHATSDDLNLARDLLVLRTDEDGNPKPESPSSLETLLVSPLSWLLGRLDALPDPWSADALDALLQGNIAHGVFENLFEKDGQLIARDDVESAVDDALAEVIRQQAPLLSTAQWKVERNTLRSTLIQAVKNWRDVLEVLDAKVVGVEASLKGEFSGIPIRGFSDEVVQLPGGKLAVVDFKKSSSGKRRERMELGYDCQVSLYEKMINDNPDELGVETSSETPGIIYYTLNDQRVIADDRTGLPNNVPGLIVVSNDVSVNALEEIKEQINKLKMGIIEMNHESDAETFAKEKALPDFALQATPLVSMFAHPDPVEGEQ